ncbi:MAG: NAD(+) diphosphatase [Syntrophobacteraceae bacterium]
MDNFTRSSHNMFVSQAINRAGIRGRKKEWIRDHLGDPESFFVPVWQSRVLVSDGDEPRPILLSYSQARQFAGNDDESVFLGREEGRCYFAVSIQTPDAAPPAELTALGRFRDLRAVGPLLSQNDGALLAYAKIITYWHGRNRFCGVCGSPNRVSQGGHQRTCSDPGCGALHFPRTDPAIIVLVRSGEKCLLGRQSVWPERMYSVLAGFVEPGESAEAAVVREVFEETSVRVTNIHYHSSQPWPFPCSLMIGFCAEAEGEEVCLRDRELEDARWFSREEFRTAVEGGAIRLPSRISIAHQLIRDWFDAQSPVPLRELATPERTAYYGDRK